MNGEDFVVLGPDGMVVPPEGRRTGALLRPDYELPGSVCPLLREAIDVIPQADWDKYIDKTKMRHLVREVFDQDGVGSCCAEATTQAVAIVRELMGQPHVKLNPWSLYRLSGGGYDDGSSVSNNLKYARDVGILPESYHPRSKGWNARPPEGWQEVAREFRLVEFYEVTNTIEMGTALLRGFPVVFAWSGHSCCAVELISKTHFRYVNSWGNWGDGGFGTLALTSVGFKSYGAFCVRSVTLKKQGG